MLHLSENNNQRLMRIIRTSTITGLITLFATVLIVAQETIPSDIYKKRRDRFMESIGNAIAIIPGDVRTSNGQADNNLVSYFYYLTGLDDPGAWLILNPNADSKYLLFVRPFNPAQVIWTGEMPGLEGALKVYGADEAFQISQFRAIASGLLESAVEVYTISGNRWLRNEIDELVPDGSSLKIVNAQPILDEMRCVKDSHEIAQLRKAINITVEAHRKVLDFIEPGTWEYETEALIEYTFRKNGATGPAFSSIVGSGPRSTVLHYEANNNIIEEGDLVVMDIGAEVNRYKADVTRTVPANGTFSEEQLEIYNIVLEAQKKAIEVMVPGEKISRFNEVASAVIMDGLFNLGLVTDKKSNWQKQISVLYFTGHFIGLDIHDVFSYTTRNLGTMVFKPGMIITIEPGIYIHPGMLENLHDRLGDRVPAEEINEYIMHVGPVFEKYKNIGVRIEDDILITPTGNEILSIGAPKEPEDIEKIMNR